VTARTLSLAAGTILDVDPANAVVVAQESGFDAVGLWFDPDSWTDATTRTVAERLADTGLLALDIEPVLLGRGGPGGSDGGERMIEIAAALGVGNVLVASGMVSHAEATERLATLAAHAAMVAPGTMLVLEFLPIFSVATLAEAAAIVRSIGAPNVGVLVDTLHLDRSGSRLSDANGVPLPYLQLADAGPDRPSDLTGLRVEALDGRLLPGEGVLPLVEVLRAVPDVPVSVELRSARLVTEFPDPVARARVVHAASAAVLSRAG
jgi:sugar phosphate isomerase/epimerase